MSQQWEYCRCYWGGSSEGLTYFGGSGEIERRGATVVDALPRLGVAGWELVGVAAYSGQFGVGTTLYFKRPIEPGRAIDDGF
jgi:hypothetical protein